jgi:hypothetical protein
VAAQILAVDGSTLERTVGPEAAARVLDRAATDFNVVPIYITRPPGKRPGIGDNGGPALSGDETGKSAPGGSPPPEKPDLRKLEPVVLWLAERALRERKDRYTGVDGSDTAVRVRLDPRLGEPAAGRGYQPADASHFNGLGGEYGLANDIAEHLPDETVVEFGRKAGERGPDVISVNREGEVTFWDSKWRSSDTSIGRWARAHKTDESFYNALDHAKDSIEAAMESGRLSPEVGEKALLNLRNRNATIVTVGTGSARNGVIEQIVGGNRTISHP